MDKNPVIKKLDPSQLEAACNALMMGFSSDPFQRWLMPDPTIYYKNFKKWTVNTCKQSFLNEGVYGDENNYGTAVWFTPEFDIDFTDVSETYKEIPKDRITITESGIFSATDISLMAQHDIYSFLIGEAFMRDPDPGQALKKLIL